MMPHALPTISIVTPCYRHAHFLEATIESVLGQRYPRLEYVIVDGGSDDGSVDIIRRYQKHLHWWCSESDQGHYDAINKGFRHTSGDIMAWLNSDDVYLPWTLRTVGTIFAELDEVSWISSLEQTRIDYHGFCLGSERIAGFSRAAFADGCYVANPGHRGWFLGWIQQESTFWRRSLWNAVGATLRPRYSLAGDFDLWARFYAHADLVGTPSPLAGFRLSWQQRSSQAVAYREQAVASLAESSGMQPSLPPRHPQEILPLAARLGILGKRSFQGMRVVREHHDQPHGRWKLQRHGFTCRRSRSS